MISKNEWLSDILRNQLKITQELSHLYSIHDIQPIKTESWNGIFKGLGDKDIYCVKIINDVTTDIPRSISDLLFMCQYVKFLSNSYFDSHIPFVPSRDGNILNVILNYRVLVSPWIEDFSRFSLCEEHAQSPEIVKLGAGLLAKLHNISSEYKITEPSTRELPHCLNPFMWKNNIDSIFNTAFENLRNRNSSQDGINKLRTAHKMCVDFIDREKEFFQNNISQQIMNHGDFRPENMVVLGRKSAKIFDFDICHIDYPEADVAYGALAFSGARWFCGKRDWNLVDLFKTTYASKSDIVLSPTRYEKALIWILLKMLSVSFKEQQLEPRLQLLNDIRVELSYH